MLTIELVLERLGCWEGVYNEATVLEETSIRRKILSMIL